MLTFLKEPFAQAKPKPGVIGLRQIPAEESLATVRMMYWKEIPVQVQAEDENGRVSKPLEARFQEAVDAVAMFDGSAGSDAYLEGWTTGEPRVIKGPAEVVANSLADEFNKNMPGDFVARIRDLQNSGQRDESPGAIDSWAGVDLPRK